MSSRELILDRIRRAVADGSGPHGVASGDDRRAVVSSARDHAYRAEPAVGRAYLREHGRRTAAENTDLLAENLADYRAIVHRTDTAGLPALIAALLADTGRVVVPFDLPVAYLTEVAPSVVVRDADEHTPAELDRADAVVTGCALAIAETGTIVLDAGPGQGRRRITLIPDRHICVVRVSDQVVASVPQALERLDPTRPLTWISGPSATSDIELDRVEGVHGPRRLDVVLVES